MADPSNRTEGYQGMLEPNVIAKIMTYKNEDDNSVREADSHQPGEPWLKSSSCVQGYYKNMEATKGQFTNDGWYKTCDVGFFHCDKSYFLDRKNA
jgi:long-subunit acyl-CoA synthetase (AMP-forming)